MGAASRQGAIFGRSFQQEEVWGASTQPQAQQQETDLEKDV